MSKPYFYRLDAAGFLAAVVAIQSDKELAKFIRQLSIDLVTGSPSSEYADKLISEASDYIEKKRIAGSKGGKQRSSNAQAVLDECSSITQANSSSNNNNSNNNKKKKDIIPYQEILTLLNDATQSNFKLTDKFKSLVSARWSEGHRVEDFRHVFEVKVADWRHDLQMSKFLRPDTLLGTKFDSYRQQRPPVSAKNNKFLEDMANELQLH